MQIFYDMPFQITTFESIAVSAEVLDKYVGDYSTAGVSNRAKITREGSRLFFQPPGAGSAFPLEATAQDKFKLDNGTPAGVEFSFDATKSQMTIRRGGGKRVFTKQE
jgi:hypothetical protein